MVALETYCKWDLESMSGLSRLGYCRDAADEDLSSANRPTTFPQIIFFSLYFIDKGCRLKVKVPEMQGMWDFQSWLG